MKTQITVLDIMNAKPCSSYSQEVVTALWAGKETLSSKEISELDIPGQDRLWALINTSLTEKEQRLFACDCAERTLNREIEKGNQVDPRSLEAIEVSRKYAAGLATLAELNAAWDTARDAASSAARDAARAAASSAARAAASSAACSAAWAAAWAAASSAASSAARDAAWAAEVSWQIVRILEIKD